MRKRKVFTRTYRLIDNEYGLVLSSRISPIPRVTSPTASSTMPAYIITIIPLGWLGKLMTDSGCKYKLMAPKPVYPYPFL